MSVGSVRAIIVLALHNQISPLVGFYAVWAGMAQRLSLRRA